MDSGSAKRHKISLNDYPSKQDLENRLLMAQFTPQDVAVLEEILYSSIRVPLQKLEKNTNLKEDELLPILVKLSRTGLLLFEEDAIVVDKELRKYFEGQIVRFEPEFKPNMEFIQNLLRKVPIHVLPIWYSLPRLSNHIFESIIEKYLLTPSVFQRYLSDLHFSDPTLAAIVKDVYGAPDLKVYGKELIAKYKLSREQFEEMLMQLEFHLVCFLGYEQDGNAYQEIVTPFQEWCDYRSFLKSTLTLPLPPQEMIERKRPHDFSYIQDLTQVLLLAKKQPIPVSEEKGGKIVSTEMKNQLATLLGGFKVKDPIFSNYLNGLTQKLNQLKLSSIVDGHLHPLENATDFLEMSLEDKALFLYRHPLNRLFFASTPSEIATDRNIREAEKSIVRVLSTGWVYFDDFVKGLVVPLTEPASITLRKQGKTWKYQLPSYSDEELAFIKAIVLEWLFEMGITAVGNVNARECFCVTAFGRSLFGQ